MNAKYFSSQDDSDQRITKLNPNIPNENQKRREVKQSLKETHETNEGISTNFK